MEELSRLNKRFYISFDIAKAFNDEARLATYIGLCKKHGLPRVLRAFAEAKAVPQGNIKRSRLHLFRYLLKLYAAERSHHHRP